MKKVLILTASFGEGHNTAARNIRDALERLDDEVAVEVLDLFALTYGRVHDFVRRIHLQVVQRTPRLWAELYNWLDTSASFDGRSASGGCGIPWRTSSSNISPTVLSQPTRSTATSCANCTKITRSGRFG